MIKRILFFAITVFLLIINSGCNKEKKMSITYPSDGAYGINVLALSNSSVLNSGNDYSLCAELGKKAELKIIITNLSASGAVWFYADKNGWTVSNYEGNTQEFKSNKDGRLDLDIIFENGPGSCRVDFYENSSTVTESKTYSW